MTTWATWDAIKAGEVHCFQCDDTGWEILTRPVRALGVMAPWMVAQLDPKIPRPLVTPTPALRAGAVITSAQPCPCRDTNPIWQARRPSPRGKTTGGDA